MVFTASHRDITMDDLSKMPYLEWCIKETLRIFPSVPWFGRALSKDTEFGKFYVLTSMGHFTRRFTIHHLALYSVIIVIFSYSTCVLQFCHTCSILSYCLRKPFQYMHIHHIFSRLHHTEGSDHSCGDDGTTQRSWCVPWSRQIWPNKVRPWEYSQQTSVCICAIQRWTSKLHWWVAY